MTGEGRAQRHLDPCPKCGEPVPIKRTGRPAIWCSQKCRRGAYEERRAASQGAIAVEVVDRVTYVEHELKDCLAEVLNSPLACRRVLYRLRQMLRDDELHREGWRDVLSPALSLAQVIMCRGPGGSLARDIAAQGERPDRRSELTFNRDDLVAEIHDLLDSHEDPLDQSENQTLNGFLESFAALLSRTDRFYFALGQPVPVNQLVVVADALQAAHCRR